MALDVSVVTPERAVWSGEATFLIARADGGDVGVLPGMAPFLGALHHARLIVEQGDSQTYIAVHGGFIQVFGDRVSVLTEVAEPADEIDVERARRQRDEAQAAVDREDTEENRNALLRASNRLETAAEAGILGVG